MSEQPREPLSEERLYEIRTTASLNAAGLELLREVDRLRAVLERQRDAYLELRTEANTLLGERDLAEAELAAARAELAARDEIVRAMADGTIIRNSRDDYAATSSLVYPGRETSRQLRDKARALLAAQAKAPGEAAEPDSGEEGAG